LMHKTVHTDQYNYVTNSGRRIHPSLLENVKRLYPSEVDPVAAAPQITPNFLFPRNYQMWDGATRNFLDESAANVFANAKHAAQGNTRLVSIFKNDYACPGGEGRANEGFNSATRKQASLYGDGVRSLNIFDLDKLV
jgi:hypothetical protein